MKFSKLKLILAVLVSTLFISSCSGPDELLIRESDLKRALSNNAENCDLLWRLENYGDWAQIGLYSLEPSEATVIANKLKSYSFEVLNVIKSDPYITAEFFSDFAFFQQKISTSDLGSGFLREIGKTYFPDCGYFMELENTQAPTVTDEISPQSNIEKVVDIELKAPSLVFWGVPFKITARSFSGEMESCTFKFGGSNSMYAETLGKVFASKGVAEISHTLVWNGGLGSTAWSKYWAVCSVNGNEYEIDSVDVQGAR